jgi:hypothetical protein
MGESSTLIQLFIIFIIILLTPYIVGLLLVVLEPNNKKLTRLGIGLLCLQVVFDLFLAEQNNFKVFALVIVASLVVGTILEVMSARGTYNHLRPIGHIVLSLYGVGVIGWVALAIRG